MIEAISLDQINFTALLVMVFVMRNEIKNIRINQGENTRRIEKLEDKT